MIGLILTLYFLYAIFTFIGNVGGQIGLFIGGSFLSLLEIVEYVYDKLAQQRSRYRRKTGQIEKAEWKKIYASSMIVHKGSDDCSIANQPPPYERTLIQLDDGDSTEGFLNGPRYVNVHKVGKE